MLHPQSPIFTQRACAAYVASFLSRAKYVKPMAVVTSLHHMVVWSSNYITAREQHQQHQQQQHQLGQHTQHTQYQQQAIWLPGAKQHETFYSVCQASFYIICFVGSTYLINPEQTTNPEKRKMRDRVVSLLHQLPWCRVIFSPLNPLKYCLHDVRNEFVNVCKSTGILEAKQEELEIRVSHIEAMDNENSGSSGGSGGGGGGGGGGVGGGGGGGGSSMSDDFVSGDNPLDSFFPYDPYLLSKSSTHIDPLYVVWSKNEDSEVEEEEDGFVESQMVGLPPRSNHTTPNTTAMPSNAIAIPQARRRTDSFFASGGGDAGEDLFGSTAAGGGEQWEEDYEDEGEGDRDEDEGDQYGMRPMSLGEDHQGEMSMQNGGFRREQHNGDAYHNGAENDRDGVGLEHFARPRIVSGSGSW
jgi:uncharacterized membrane protein YgcG